MPRGGYRNGAGRKKGAENLLTKELRDRINAHGLIIFLQDLALGKVETATISERKDAAVALLKKVLPDCRQDDVSISENSRVILMISKEENEL